MSTAPTLVVEDLKTWFYTKAGVVKAVDGVSFRAEAGKIVGLVGESGSGKTVTGFSIIGLVDPPGRIEGGRILFKGRNLVGLTEEELRKLRGSRIAMIFQDPMMTLNPVLRIDTQMIETVLAHAKVSREEARQRARDALGQVGIPSPEERLKAYPHQFSGGMRQRVMIAMAIACRPALLLADEPTTALDVTIQAQVLAVLAKLKSTYGMSMVFITHNLGVVALIADRVAVMYAGEIVEIAAVGDLYSEPMHPYTAALLDAMPRVDRTEDVQPIPGSVPALTDIPSGCAYAARCPLKQPCCEKDHPELLPIDGTNQRFVRCFVRSAK